MLTKTFLYLPLNTFHRLDNRTQGWRPKQVHFPSRHIFFDALPYFPCDNQKNRNRKYLLLNHGVTSSRFTNFLRLDKSTTWPESIVEVKK